MAIFGYNLRSLARCPRLKHPMTSALCSRAYFSSEHFADPSLVDSKHAPTDFTPECAVVYRDFLSEPEGDLLTQGILSRMKRRRYEKGHWDTVITNYKEVELPDEMFEDPRIPEIFARARQLLEEYHLMHRSISWLPCHAIDLKKDGELNAHVDSIKFSGDLVSGISLLSPSIMRLVPEDDPDNGGHVDLFLPQLSLYALTGVGRYRYSHHLLPDQSTFTSPNGDETSVARDHRLSVIFRDTKPTD